MEKVPAEADANEEIELYTFVIVLLTARPKFMIELEFAEIDEYIPLIDPAVFTERLDILAEFREIPAEFAVICVLICANVPATAFDKVLREPPRLPMEPYKPVTELAIEVPSEVNDAIKAEFVND